MKSLKKSLVMILMLQALLFIGCGGGGSTSEKETPEVETLAQIETLDVNDTVSSGTMVGKVTIPTKSQDSIEKVELTGDGSEKFTISTAGEISTKTALKATSKISKSSTQKIEITNKAYNFKVKVTYTSGKVVYINVKITVHTYNEVVVNSTANYFIAKDNSFHDVNATFGIFNVVVYTDKKLDDIPSNTTKAIYGTIDGVPTNALLSVNSNYIDGTAFIVKVFKDANLVGESEKSILSGITLEFSDITTK